MDQKGRRRPVLADVARRAGVSQSTASRALSAKASLISTATQQRVKKAAKELGYQTNPIARSLRIAKTSVIGMVVPSISNPFFTRLVEEVEHVLYENNYYLYLSDSRRNLDTEARLLRAFESGLVDGVLIVPCHEMKSAPSIADFTSSIPLIQLDRPTTCTKFSSVGIDERQSMFSVIKHLKELGVQTIGVVSSRETELTSMLRLKETEEACRFYDVCLPRKLIVEGEHSISGGAEAVETLLASNLFPDALVCFSNLLSVGAIKQLKDQGIGVPEDVLVTGFDDTPFAALFRPSLTTVRQPVEQMARTAVSMLLEASSSVSHYRLPGRLIRRESTLLEASYKD